MITISSQRYLNDEIVAEKVAHDDFEVAVSPAFEIDGQTYRVVLDGHHSLAAARASGAEPVFVEYDATDNDKVALIERGDFEGFLEIAYVDSDYYDISTGKDVW